MSERVDCRSQVSNIRNYKESKIIRPMQNISSKEGINSNFDDFKLTIKDFNAPAYLVNYNFEIEWVNEDAEQKIFNNNVSAIDALDARNVFKLFFSWELHDHIQNWKELIIFHIAFVKSRIQKNEIPTLFNSMTDNQAKLVERLYSAETNILINNITDNALDLELLDGSTVKYQVYTVFFREGILFIYSDANNEKARGITSLLTNRGKVINDLLRNRLPSLVSLCVLVADLQNSVKISAELPPREYFDLVNQLWKTLEPIFERYNGIYGKHAGDGVLYYFIKKPGTNYIFDAINCAIDIKDAVMRYNTEWKIRKGWLNDLFLNIGLNEGQEFFGIIHSSSNIEFSALGDTINVTGRLSDFARYGSILTTKNALNKLSSDEIDTLKFGVTREQNGKTMFIESSFSRIVDMFDSPEKMQGKFMDIANMSITEIASRKE